MRVCPRCHSIYTADPGFCGVDGAELIEQEEDPLIGRTVDRYMIRERIGSGGMGCVYRARHVVLEREYAIKVLFGDMAAHKTLAERFRREAMAVSKMSHPNIVEIGDFGTTDTGLTFLVMELLEGRSLAEELLARGQLPPARAASIAQQIAAGLAEAHRHGFVHRDLKPGNVMLTQERGQEKAKILDFGIVGMVKGASDSKLTRTGFVLGTPAYMSPEQAQDSEVSYASDLYALGVIFYEMLAGHLPFTGESSQMVMVRHITEPPPRLPPCGGLEDLVYALLAKRPEERPESAEHVSAQLEKHIERLKNAKVHETQFVPARAPTEAALPRSVSKGSAAPVAAPPVEAPRPLTISSNPPPSPSDELLAIDAVGMRPGMRAGIAMLALGGAIVAGTLIFNRTATPDVSSMDVAPISATAPELKPIDDPKPAEPAAPKVDPTPAPVEQPTAVIPQEPSPREPVRQVETKPIKAETKTKKVEPQNDRARLAELEKRFNKRLSDRGLSMADLDAVPAARAAARRWLEARKTPGPEAEATLEALIAEVDKVEIGQTLVKARLDRLDVSLAGAKDKLPAEELSAFEDRYLELATEAKPGMSEWQARALLARIERLSGDLSSRLRKN